jgi:hypothetical protein
LLRSGSFPWSTSRWSEVRDRLRKDSNLFRLIELSQRYRAIIRSDASDEGRIAASRKLLDEMDPLGRVWLAAQLRRRLRQDIDRATLREKIDSIN